MAIWRGEFNEARTPPPPPGLKVIALGESAEPLLDLKPSNRSDA